MTPPKARKSPLAGRLISYARVSTGEQGTDPQLDELRPAGCATILEEHASASTQSASDADDGDFPDVKASDTHANFAVILVFFAGIQDILLTTRA